MSNCRCEPVASAGSWAKAWLGIEWVGGVDLWIAGGRLEIILHDQACTSEWGTMAIRAGCAGDHAQGPRDQGCDCTNTGQGEGSQRLWWGTSLKCSRAQQGRVRMSGRATRRGQHLARAYMAVGHVRMREWVRCAVGKQHPVQACTAVDCILGGNPDLDCGRWRQRVVGGRGEIGRLGLRSRMVVGTTMDICTDWRMARVCKGSVPGCRVTAVEYAGLSPGLGMITGDWRCAGCDCQ